MQSVGASAEHTVPASDVAVGLVLAVPQPVRVVWATAGLVVFVVVAAAVIVVAVVDGGERSGHLQAEQYLSAAWH